MGHKTQLQDEREDRSGPARWELDLRAGLLDTGAVSLLGFDLTEAPATAEWWDTRIHTDDLGAVRAARARHVLGTSAGYRSEYRARHRDGSWIWLLEVGNVIQRDMHGEALRVAGVLLDITNDKEAQFRTQQRLDRLRTVFDYTCQFASLLTPEGILIEANNTSLKAGKVALYEVVGQPFWDTAFWNTQAPEQIQLLRDGIRCAARGEPARFNQTVTESNGTVHHLDISLQPVLDDAGAVVWILAEGRDITDIMTAQKHLRMLQERLTIAVEGANLGLWDANRVTGSLWCNDTWWTMLGYAPGELAIDAFNWDTLLHPDDREHTIRSLRDRVASGNSGEINLEFRMRSKDGSWRWIHASGRTVERDDSGGPQRVVGLHLDVTDRKDVAMRLATADRLESVGKLAAGIAHEINTPIQFVSDSTYFIKDAVAELLRLTKSLRALMSGDERLAARAAELASDLPYLAENLPKALERSIDGLNRVTEIIGSMREFAHPDRHEMTQIDLNRAIQSTLVVARNEYRYVADVDTELGSLPPVYCHAGQVNQVLLNLIVNAAHSIRDAHQETGRKGQIRITSRVDADAVLISVADSGTGIAENIRHRIFEPFFTTKEVGRGTGQGLAIAHNIIVKRHGGNISFKTGIGTGTVFYIRLPIDARQPAAAPGQAA